MRQKFSSGLMITLYSPYNDVNSETNYIYDKQGRIIKAGSLWRYEYPKIDFSSDAIEMERTVYYNNTLREKDRIESTENGYNVSILEENAITRTKKYVKINGTIQNITEIMNGKEWAWYSFYYKDGVLDKLVVAMNTKDSIRILYKITSTDGKNILSLIRQDFRDNKVDTTNQWLFKNYDEYGNWHDAEHLMEGKLLEIYHRAIEYFCTLPSSTHRETTTSGS